MNKIAQNLTADALRVGFAAMLILCLGCRGTGSREPVTTSKVTRYTESGSESFAEGDTSGAINAFRKALHRSWATDDPYQSGTSAYNLAAALYDRGDTIAAVEWLVDARVAFARAGTSAGNTYLLEAKIAREEGRYEDARRLISLAQCAPPPCTRPNSDDPCDCDPDSGSWLECIPCVGDDRQEQRQQALCRDDYRAQVALAKARLAAEQFEIEEAKKHLACAIAIATEVCSDDLRADIRHTAAMIDLACGHYAEAAAHLDREAFLLRRARNYRRLPEVLTLAAATHNSAGQFDQAVDRLCRTARILFTRGQLEDAWEVLQEALASGEVENSPSTRIRLKLTALEIEAAASSKREVSRDSSREAETVEPSNNDEPPQEASGEAASADLILLTERND